MKSDEILQCSVASWYPKFRKDTFTTHIIDIDDEFINYLNEDGIVVPDFEDDPPEFHKRIYTEVQKGFEKLNNVAFVKLNWSSPKDARWILPNSNLQCRSIDDIYILLKSSDRIAHDLTQPFKDCEDEQILPAVKYVLALRKWEDFCSSWEFRCFVKDRTLIGISQRDISTHWPYIKEQKKEIVHQIRRFFEEKILNRFPLASFVVDIARYSKEKLKIIDFNPFGATTDSLLFSWEELTSSDLGNMPGDVSEVAESYISDENEESDVALRYIKESMSMQSTSYRLNNFPVDVMIDPEQFAKAMRTDNYDDESDSSEQDDA